AEGLAHGSARIREQREGQPVLLDELLVRRHRIAADADHLDARVREVAELIAEGARLARAARRVVLRVEVDDQVLLPAEVGERDALPVLVVERELRRARAGAEARATSEQRFQESHRMLLVPIFARLRLAARRASPGLLGRCEARDDARVALEA